MRLLIVQHEDAAGLGTLEAPLRERAELDVWFPNRTGAPPAPLAAYDGLVVLGGFAHPDQDDEHPWLAKDRALLREALDRELPTLGICLGSQLLAQASGGEAYRLVPPEVGWFPLDASPAAEDDPLVGGLQVPVFAWHHYGFRPGDAAVPLARTERSWQAFRVGERAWGLQFHIEVDEATVEHWLAAEPGDVESSGGGVEALRSRTRQLVTAYEEAATILARRFGDEVERAREGAAGPPVVADR